MWEVFAVCGFHTQEYCTIYIPTSGSILLMCYPLYGHIRTSVSCCCWSLATPQALIHDQLQMAPQG